MARFIRDAGFDKVDAACLTRLPAATFFEPIDPAHAATSAQTKVPAR
jgi:hypothetical protein